MPDLIYIIDQDGFVLECLSSGSTADDLADADKVLHRNLAELFDSRFSDELRKEIQKARIAGQSDSSEFKFRMHGGDKQYYELRFARLYDDKVLAVARNITERALATQKIINLSILDKLTNVYNRNHFEQIAGNLKDPQSERTGLFMVDIDGLKLVGRGAPTLQKVRNIQLAGEFLALAAAEPDFAAYRRRAMAAHRARFGAECHPNICYYPELLPQGAFGDE